MYRHTKILQPGNLVRQILFLSILSMLTSLFLSRTALSVSMMTFVLASIGHKEIKAQLNSFISSPLLWGMSLLFILPLISGTWSEDRSTWLRIMMIKSPLLFMPLAFARPFDFSKTQWKWIGLLFITLVVAATGWSLFAYLNNYSLVNKGYLQGKAIPTLLENDRVRLSLLVAFSIFLCGWMMIRSETARFAKIFLGLVSLWLIIFLHILSVRTGLISFYLGAIFLVMWMVRSQKKKTAILVLLGICMMAVTAFFLFPSFQNRVKYFLYELDYFKNSAYIPGGNDATRVISLKAGWEIMNDHPFIGTGIGDLDAETLKWYQEQYPQMLERDRIAPSSEWLIYGVAAGWPGFLIFTLIMLIPFLLPERKWLSWIMLNSVMAFSFLFDLGLEVQFGVFIYSFIVLCWWKWLLEKNQENIQP